MFKGFYNLTSGVLTHQRNLNVIANNMTNISTPGYKQDKYLATTFDEVMYSKVGNKDSQGNEIGSQSYIRATSDIITDFIQGTLEHTGYSLDFAINGNGFFAIQNQNGEISYTRNGNFSIDDAGYLCLPGIGYVLNPQGSRIKIDTDKIYADNAGNIYRQGGDFIGQVGVYNFENTDNLERNAQGHFVGGNAQPIQTSQVLNSYIERSNTDVMKQMTDMITVQRSLQSSTQLMKMYDNIMTKATGEIGRLQ